MYSPPKDHPWKKGWSIEKKKEYYDSKGSYRYDYSTRNGREYFHRLVVESVLGRKLESSEYVHHRDGNNLNNDAMNLTICKDGGRGHATYHQRMGSFAWNRIPWRDGCPNKGKTLGSRKPNPLIKK